MTGVLFHCLSSHPPPGDTSTPRLPPSQPGHRVRHPIPRALSMNAHFPSASSVSCAETSRCHTARTDRSVQGSSSTRTARPVWATSSALTVCRRWHSSSGGSPSTLTITMFVSTVVRSTEQTGDASSWSPEPRSCGKWSPTPVPHHYPYHSSRVTPGKAEGSPTVVGGKEGVLVLTWAGLALLLFSSVTLDKSVNLLGSRFPHL